MTKKTLKQVDETKKPVIPQLIADLIEECKKTGTRCITLGQPMK